MVVMGHCRFMNTKTLKEGRKNMPQSMYVPYPKGRQADEASLKEVRALLGAMPLRRDLLVEYLHRLQDSQRALFHRHLVALAEILRLPLAEVFEVASFYAHFDICADDATVPHITVRVCDSISCALRGASSLLAEAQKQWQNDESVRVVAAPCMGRCDEAPITVVGQHHLAHSTLATIKKTVGKKDIAPVVPSYRDFGVYRREGGYRLYEACVAGKHDPEQVIEQLGQANLRGKGGAGFPAAQKWKFVRAASKPRLLTINADEGEPGTFKDKYYMEKDLHRFLEGALIAAWAVEAQAIYIYLRDEYPAIHHMLMKELTVVNTSLPSLPAIHVRRGAGAYICGEESAMIESIEGKRGLPRHKPPYISTVGLFGKPTLNQNVETVYWIRDIMEKGASWYASLGKGDFKGIHSFSVSGRVKNPGVKVAAAGITMNELLHEHCDGMEDGHEFKGYLPGGASGGVLPASMADIPLDFGQLEEHGCFLGSAAVVVFSDKDSVRDVVVNLLRFFEDESCGQCTPCRVGTEKAVALLEKNQWNAPLLTQLVSAMRDASICGLGQAAGNPIDCALRFFPQEVGIS